MAGAPGGRWTGGTDGASGDVNDRPRTGTCAQPNGPVLNVCSPDFSGYRTTARFLAPAALQPSTGSRHQGYETTWVNSSHWPSGAPLARRHTRLPTRPRVSFYFDLASPWTYLAAERVDQRFADVRWQPAVGDALPGGARRRARSARPSRSAPTSCGCRSCGPRRSRRPGAAPCASPRSPPSTAAPRSSCSPPAAWPSAAATTSTTPRSWPRRPPPPASACDECLHAAGEMRRDGAMEQAALRLLSQGADALPVLVVGRALFCGEHRLRRGGRRRQRAPRGAPAGAPQLRRLSQVPARADAPGRIQGDAQGPAAAPVRPARPALPARGAGARLPARRASSWAAACCCSTSTSTSRWSTFWRILARVGDPRRHRGRRRPVAGLPARAPGRSLAARRAHARHRAGRVVGARGPAASTSCASGAALPVALNTIPISIFVTLELDGTLPGFLAIAAGAVVVLAYGVFLRFFVTELAMRPVLADVSCDLPDGADLGERSVPLRGKLLVALPVINVITGVVVAGLASERPEPARARRRGAGRARRRLHDLLRALGAARALGASSRSRTCARAPSA